MSSQERSRLCDVYDVAMLDLDGVVYVGTDAVPGAASAIARAREAGMRCAFITNNAARPPRDVVEHLRDIGVASETSDVVTSAQAAARVLLERCGAGARVAVLGGVGLTIAVAEAGLTTVAVDEDAEAIVSGYGPDVAWRDVMRAAVRVRDGLLWVASNTDATIPTPFGVAPGHGVLVETVQRFAGVDPVVAGKPARPLLEETLRRTGAERALMIGDRLDTDIAGAHAVGVDSLLVMTGVSGVAELLAARPDERPTYLAADLGGLLEEPRRAEEDDGAWCLGGWAARAQLGEDPAVHGSGTASDWWRVVAATGWHRADHGEGTDDLLALTPPSGDADSR